MEEIVLKSVIDKYVYTSKPIISNDSAIETMEYKRLIIPQDIYQPTGEYLIKHWGFRNGDTLVAIIRVKNVKNNKSYGFRTELNVAIGITAIMRTLDSKIKSLIDIVER